MPLILLLKDVQKWTQVWYADDANCCGKLVLLRNWFDTLLRHGPAFGYFPEPSKSCLVVARCDIPEAERLFGDLGVKICTSHRVLGGHVGSAAERSDFVQEKVQFWTQCVSRLADAAIKEPQDAYAALTKSLSFEWNFLPRIVPDCGDLFRPLEEVIDESFLPQLLGWEFSAEERQLFALPVKFAGLGIIDPTTTACPPLETSRKATDHLSSAIQGRVEVNLRTHQQAVLAARSEHRIVRKAGSAAVLSEVISSFSESKQRAVRRAADHPIGAWLSVTPSIKNNAALSPREFRDRVATRYHKPLVQMPSVCDGCGAEFSVDHGLNCPKGGDVIERHNEIRDVTGQLTSMAFSHVTSEPVVREASTARGERDQCGLVCDLAVWGVWHPQTEALFDFRVCNADAQSYANRPVTAVLDSLAQAKKTKHAQACRQRRADFRPFIVTTDGVIQREGQHFLRRLASRLANKWSRSYSTTMSFVRTQLSLAILRGTARPLSPLRPQEDVAPSV